MLFLIFSHLQIAFWQSQCTCPEQVLGNVEETHIRRRRDCGKFTNQSAKARTGLLIPLVQLNSADQPGGA
jgi:hypothetical protein